MDKQPPHVTQLLKAWKDGDDAAFAQLAQAVETELRYLAQNRMRRERQGHVLQATALVNEAWMRLIKWQNVS